MKSKTCMIVLIVLLVILMISAVLYYLIMFVPTNQLFDYAKNIMNGEIQPPKDDPFYRYSLEAACGDAVSVKCTVRRMWVFHDEVFGYIHVNYTQLFHNKSGEQTTASGPCNAIWIIYKINGEWVVVDIIEHP